MNPLHSYKLKLIMITTIMFYYQKMFTQKNRGYMKGGFSLIIGSAATSDDVTFLPALTLSPGFRLLRTKEFSISIDLPFSAGISSNDDNMFFGIDAPATLNLNFGCGASPNSGSGFGVSLGTGAAYHYSNNSYFDNYYNERYNEVSVAGILYQTIFSFANKKKKGIDGGWGLRVYYLSNFKPDPMRKNVAGIGILSPPL